MKKSYERPEKATLAGGCFWGVEEILRSLPGVISTRVGYTGGKIANPTYPMVKRGDTGHAEAVEITFDPSKISFDHILEYFFRLHDPTTVDRQGNDTGTQYRSEIFFHSEEQRLAAIKAIERAGKSKRWGSRPIVTKTTRAGAFYEAEEYHQKYLQKNPEGQSCHYLRD